MKKTRLLFVLGVLAAVSVWAAPARRIMSVTHVDVDVLKNGAIQTVAVGEVNSGGWTRPRLQFAHIRNGVMTYMFVANPPDGPHTQAIVEVQADAIRRGNVSRVRKVRVNAVNNSMTVDVP